MSSWLLKFSELLLHKLFYMQLILWICLIADYFFLQHQPALILIAGQFGQQSQYTRKLRSLLISVK